MRRFLYLGIFFFATVAMHAGIAAVSWSRCAPQAEEFVELRAIAGLRPRSLKSAHMGIRNSLFWITLRDESQLIGMARVVGDGGTIVQICDFVVHPHYQKEGLGTKMLQEIQTYILDNIPDDAFVCLFAESEIVPFYSKHGFCLSGKQWPGMYWPCADRMQLKKQ